MNFFLSSPLLFKSGEDQTNLRFLYYLLLFIIIITIIYFQLLVHVYLCWCFCSSADGQVVEEMRRNGRNEKQYEIFFLTYIIYLLSDSNDGTAPESLLIPEIKTICYRFSSLLLCLLPNSGEKCNAHHHHNHHTNNK
jgi:hypothetical protein